MSNATEKNKIIKILSNENRLRILEKLSEAKGVLCVNQIAKALNISQSLTSQCLSYLAGHDVIKGKRSGQITCYVPANNKFAKKVFSLIKQLNTI